MLEISHVSFRIKKYSHAKLVNIQSRGKFVKEEIATHHDYTLKEVLSTLGIACEKVLVIAAPQNVSFSASGKI